MNFHVNDSGDVQNAARKWVDAIYDPRWLEAQRETGTLHAPALHAILAAAGVLGAGFKPPFASDFDPGLAEGILAELTSRGIGMAAWDVTSIVARTLCEIGTDAQKDLYVRGAISGDILISLGYSEPGAGSDLAAVRTKARRDGDDWIIDGAKMFTSAVHVASHVFVLARTNADAPQHKGLTLFLVPTTADGFAFDAIHTLGGERTNASFYNEVRVSDAQRVGDVDGGWDVMRVSLALERDGGAGSLARTETIAHRIARWAADETGDDGRPLLDDAMLQDELVRAAIDAEVTRLFAMQARWVADEGRTPVVEAAMLKLHGMESVQRHAYRWPDLIDLKAPISADIEHEFRGSVVGTIYGGSSEMMREIIAQRHLGMPRTRGSAKSKAPAS